MSSNVETGLAFILGRVYSMTLLFNLIYRKPLSKMAGGTSNTSPGTNGGRMSLKVFKSSNPSEEEEEGQWPTNSGIRMIYIARHSRALLKRICRCSKDFGRSLR